MRNPVPQIPATERIPDDDALWRDRDAQWKVLAARAGMSPGTFSRLARARGWARSHARLTHAPCRVCGESTPAAKLDEHRRCPRHSELAPPVRDPAAPYARDLMEARRWWYARHPDARQGALGPDRDETVDDDRRGS